MPEAGGPLLGDEGSGYDIALRGIRAELAAHDGSGPEAELSRTLVAELGIKNGWRLSPAFMGAI